jgi:CheY-like chemotaxis protein
MNNRTILLVEDNADDVTLTLRAFQRSQLAEELIVVKDGLEAFDYLLGQGAYAGRHPAELPRCVLLDLKLPTFSGLEILQRIRNHERTRQIPVIVLTSSREARDIEACYRQGANSYLRKPVDFLEFTEMIKYLGVYWLDLNEAPPPPGERP